MKALFDTNIVIDLLSGYPAALVEASRWTEVAISRITWMEVLIGAPNTAMQQLWERFLEKFVIIETDEHTARQAIQLRQQRRIKLPDAIIQASAMSYGGELVTRNTKDFPAGTPGVRIPYVI